MTMNILKYLENRGIDRNLRGHNSYKLESSPFMPLTIETWYAGNILNISICHYGKQNGDLMKDPDILMEFDSEKVLNQLTFIEFQNDYTGTYQSRDSNPNFQAEMSYFMETWISNLVSQGHALTEKEIEN
jgi:hypothetical protein